MQNSIVYSCLCFKNYYKSYMHFYVHKKIVQGYRKSPLGRGSGILNDREISFNTLNLLVVVFIFYTGMQYF